MIAGFLVVGVPLVALAWHNLNHLLSGDVRVGPLLTVVAAGGGLGALLFVLARVVERWTDVKRET